MKTYLLPAFILLLLAGCSFSGEQNYIFTNYGTERISGYTVIGTDTQLLFTISPQQKLGVYQAYDYAGSRNGCTQQAIVTYLGVEQLLVKTDSGAWVDYTYPDRWMCSRPSKYVEQYDAAYPY